MAVKPIITGDNHVATEAAVPPANPSKARIPAAVQFGTVAAAPINAPKIVVAVLSVFLGLSDDFIANALPLQNC